MTRIRLLSLAAVSLLGAGLLAACGGDDGGDEDPQQVLDDTFSGDSGINSGVLDVSLDASAEGEEGGSFDLTLDGPFQADEDKQGEIPELDLTANVSGEGGDQSIDFEGGLTTTSSDAFVSFQGTSYEVPRQLYDQFKQATERAARQAGAGGEDEDSGAIFDQLGIDPSGWLTNLENEGDEDVDGTETTHIHGDADVAKILEDFQALAERTGGDDAEIDPDELSEAEEAIDEASIDVFSGKEDNVLRRLDVDLALTPPEDDDSGVDSVDVEFSLTFSDVNEEQTIEAPSGAKPFSELERDLGLPPGLLDGAIGGGGLGGGGLGGGAGKPEGAAGASNKKLLDCLSKAKTAEEAQDCEP